MFRRNQQGAMAAEPRSIAEWLLDLLVGPVRPAGAPRLVGNGRWPDRSEWAQTQTAADSAAVWSLDDHSDLQLQTETPWFAESALRPARRLLRSEVGG